jgi:hypothetical protein
MKDPYEVLRQKEAEFDRVRKEVQSLNLVARLLDDNVDQPTPKPSRSETDTTSTRSDSNARDDGDGQDAGSRSGFLSALKRAS